MSIDSKYTIVKTMASGGTAVLFKAIQTSLDRTVAVKKLHQHLTNDENFTRRFSFEAKAAASLDHENIVHVIDFGVTNDSYTMIMEYVEGRSMKEVLQDWNRLSYDLALSIAYQICLGLEHAHSKGIVHRDIKPGNVMLTQYGRVKITDFGLAKLTQGTTHFTSADSILGTPLYMSPEQAFGESVDQRSDLFSLGTVLYEMLTGKQPFLSENYAAVIQNIINCKIPAPSSFDPDIPPEVEDIVLKALNKNRDSRFQNASQFRKAIEEYLGIVNLKKAEERLPSLLKEAAETMIMPKANKRKATNGRNKRRRAFNIVMGLTAVTLIAAGIYQRDLLIDTYQGLFDDMMTKRTHPVALKKSSLSGEMMSAIIEDVTAAADSTHGAKSPPEDASPKTESRTQDTIPSELHNDAYEEANTPTVENGASVSPGTTDELVEAVEEKPVQKAVKKGWFMISSDPWSEVYIDGKFYGNTPLPQPVSLPSGMHRIECRRPQHETYRETIHITGGELSRRSVTLKKHRGRLMIITTDGAEFHLDGKLVGITPLTSPLEVEVGSHLLTLKKYGYHTWSSEITVEANQSIPLRITLSPQY